MNKTLLSTTIKTSIAATLSLLVAQALGLKFSSSAGIITILDIFETRKATLKGGLKRTISAIIALVLGVLVFEIFDYKTWAFGLYLILFVPLSFLLKIELGLGPSSVVVTHLLSYEEINSSIIFNELGLILIGTGFAMLTNLYAPESQDELKKWIEDIDGDIKDILIFFGDTLVNNLDVKIYDGKIKKLEDDINKALNLAIIENDNRIENSKNLLIGLSHREREKDLLMEMYDDLKSIPKEYADGKLISDLMIDTANNLSDNGDMVKVKKRIEFLQEHFHMMELPETHEDFIIRSSIFQVFRSLNQFIDISKIISNIPRN
ncbi:MAG: aromatic acid exporter family protein [Anaerococcus vaginalis]|uniref:aromatic acid exporter family protein n=1 Tax=Anaerococcus vaginalis TaxID=33037 RepID=UPI00290CE0EC|nr:aromatic acid exporter family protein [Anaerococcus vaginalis]MDU6181164.1 aromatic acid exporter family protein [Anaerococcus vaginalis]MDU7431997.1 aromatic acid exporter family protein [Anaerococcus vaginalis]